MQPIDNQNDQVDNYTQPQVIQTSISDKTIKELGEIVVTTITTIQKIKQDGEVEIAKQETEQAKIQREVQLEQLKSDERITITLVKWDTIFKSIVFLISFGSIIAVQLLGGTTLTTTIVPVVAFILGSVFKNQIGDFIAIRTKKKGQSNVSKDEVDWLN